VTIGKVDVYNFIVARLQISAAAPVVKRAMQNTTLTSDKTATTATIPSPTPAPTQQSDIAAAAVAPSPTPEMPMDADLVVIADELAAQVLKCQANALGWQIKAADCLRDYQDQLPPSDCVQILESRRLRIGSRRKIQMLVRVARQKAFRDSKRLAQLPDSITVLHELAGLPAPVVEQALNDGTINRGTSLKQAKQFVRERRGQRPATVTRPQQP
jgi:hypothetical protein